METWSKITWTAAKFLELKNTSTRWSITQRLAGKVTRVAAEVEPRQARRRRWCARRRQHGGIWTDSVNSMARHLPVRSETSPKSHRGREGAISPKKSR